MLKRQSKVLSIALIFVFCMSFMFAGFAAPQAAQAATTYQALTIPTMDANTSNNELGTLMIDVDNVAAIRNGDVLSISFSSDVDLKNGLFAGPPAASANAVVDDTIAAARLAYAAATDAEVYVVIPAKIGSTDNGLVGAGLTSITSAIITSTGTTLDITFNGTMRGGFDTNPGRILVYFDKVKLGSISGDVTATVGGPNGSAFAMGSVVTGKCDSTGATVTSIKSAKTFGSEGLATGTDTIIITETLPGVLVKGTDTALDHNIIKIKLANGFKWAAGGGAAYAWGFANSMVAPGTTATPDPSDNRVLLIPLLDWTPAATAPAPTTSTTGAGQIRLAAPITVDDAIAKEGEVTAWVYDSKGRITETEIIVGNYASYSTKVVEGDVKELLSGKSEQRIGKFYIEEGLKGSILANRSIKITLPAGVKWWAGYRDETLLVPAPVTTVTNPISNPKVKAGDDTLKLTAGQVFVVGSNYASDYDEGRTLRFSTTALTNSKAKIEFDNLYVDVSPDFTGDVTVTVSSDAGVSGEVKVATVKPRVEATCEQIKNIRIGEQDQALGDLIINENKKEAIALKSNTVYTNKETGVVLNKVDGKISLALPAGASWSAGYPTVEVTEGDLSLDVKNMSKAYDAATGIHSINIPVKSESTKASTIKVTGMKATLNRTVPEGAFKVNVTGYAVNETGGRVGAQNLPFASYEGSKVAVANCVTPAPNEGTTGAAAGQFKIGSNIYEVNGVSKIAGTAPYIKEGRTFVPVRYLGYALGVAEADVVWDEATQKVTLTKGDNVVELTIGSTTITVNGEALTMEVAPEITNDYTMLPARYVAEGLGYEVGWDPGSQTVLLSAK